MRITDLFGNELNINDSVISVTVHNGKPEIRKGYIEDIQSTPRETAIIIKNVDTNRKLTKYVSAKNHWIASSVLKIDWLNKNHREPLLFKV